LHVVIDDTGIGYDSLGPFQIDDPARLERVVNVVFLLNRTILELVIRAIGSDVFNRLLDKVIMSDRTGRDLGRQHAVPIQNTIEAIRPAAWLIGNGLDILSRSEIQHYAGFVWMQGGLELRCDGPTIRRAIEHLVHLPVDG